MWLSLNDEFGIDNIFINELMYMENSQLKKSIRGVLKTFEPMSNHTSWRAGGNANEYFEPEDIQDLCTYLASLPEDRQLLWLGLGSNLLVRDGGYPGSVIAYNKALNTMDFLSDGHFYIEAGVPCAKVARTSAKAGYTGAEFLAGIPGTIGGALAMNAGAFGNEIWNIVTTVKTVDRKGTLRERSRNEFEISYRTVRAPAEEWFIAAEIVLKIDQDRNAEQQIRSLLEKRSDTQPMGLPSCGSVFRNPPGNFAAKLIDECGLKGKKIGKACISEKHANFIINLGGATADDIEKLIQYAQQSVSNEFGINLVPEVKIVGVRD